MYLRVRMHSFVDLSFSAKRREVWFRLKVVALFETADIENGGWQGMIVISINLSSDSSS